MLTNYIYYIKILGMTLFLCLNIYKNIEMMSYVVLLYYYKNKVILFLFSCF
jgi:hypothetical protein